MNSKYNHADDDNNNKHVFTGDFYDINKSNNCKDMTITVY